MISNEVPTAIAIRDKVVAAWARWFDPGRATLIVGGDLAGIDVEAVTAQLFGAWTRHPDAKPPRDVSAGRSITGRFVRVIHRPGSVQSEIRIDKMLL